MFKTGSKFLYGLAAFGFVAAFFYAGATTGHPVLSKDTIDTVLGPLSLGYKGYVGDHVGYSILMALSGTSLFLAILLSALRDADADAQAQVAGVDTVPEVPAPVRANYWPVVGAFSAALVVVGLATSSEYFLLGMIGLVLVTFEWAARTWADRLTGDDAVNQSIRDRTMRPLEIPVGAVLAIGVLVFFVSRILLALPKFGSYAVFTLVPALVLAVGAWIVMRPKASQSAIAGILVVAGLAVLGGGIAAAVAGPRETGGHEEEGGHSKGEEGLAPLPGPGQLVIRVAD